MIFRWKIKLQTVLITCHYALDFFWVESVLAVFLLLSAFNSIFESCLLLTKLWSLVHGPFMRIFLNIVKLGVITSIGLVVVEPLAADPNVVGDGQAYLVEVQANDSLQFLPSQGASDPYPESGVMEVYEEWLPFYDENHPKHAFNYVPKRSHFYVQGNHDMLIPLGAFTAGEVTISYSGIETNGFFSGTATVGHSYQSPVTFPSSVDPVRCWVREHSGSTSWNKEHPVKLRVGHYVNNSGNKNGWYRQYFLQLNRLGQTSDSLSHISITVETRNLRFDTHTPFFSAATLLSAENSVVPQTILENFKSPYDVNTKMSISGSPILTEATAVAALSGDFLRTNQLNDSFRANTASFGTSPRTTELNNGINISSSGTIGLQSNRAILNSFLTLSNPGNSTTRQQLMFDPNQIYATADLNIEANAWVKFITPEVIVSNDLEVAGELNVAGSPVVTSDNLDSQVSAYLNAESYLKADSNGAIFGLGNINIQDPYGFGYYDNSFVPGVHSSFVQGAGNSVGGIYSFASGYGNWSTSGSHSSFLLGTSNGALVGNTQFGVGSYNRFQDSADHSVAFGKSNELFSSLSFAFGEGNDVSGSSAIAIGKGLDTSTAGAIVLGKFNQTVGSEPDSYTDLEQPILVVGNGTGHSAAERSDALVIKRNGDVIISKPQGDVSMGIYGN